MDERHRSLCLAESQRMLQLAAITDSTEAFSWTQRSRDVALLAAAWLQEEAERLQRRAAVGSMAVLGRSRARLARIERSFQDIGREEARLGELRRDLEHQSPSMQERAQRTLLKGEESLQNMRLALRDFLEAQQNRAMYEELAEILRTLVEHEEGQGHRGKADSYREMLRQFEARLDNGDFDGPRDPAELARDQKILDFFRSQLATLGEPTPEEAPDAL